ncbi:MAG: hypothetical protein IJQ31_06935 [Thermoguttaceae bacterium]|nr:hypothetical protein [Thermoguttaceae bacterium]
MRFSMLRTVVFLAVLSPAALFAGSVWNGGTGSYTDAAQWSDYAENGKWVISGADNEFTTDVNVTGGVNLTVTGSGTVVAFNTVSGASRVEQGSNTTTLTIQDGATVKLATNSLSISDSSGVSTGYVNVNGGTLNANGKEIRVGFHHHGYLNVTNGGVVSGVGSLTVGGLDTRQGIGHVTVGGTDSDSNTGSITATTINMGLSSPGTTEMTVNNGTVSATNFNLGLNTANSDGQVHDVTLTIKEKGTVTLSNSFSAANHAQKNALINIDGGLLAANYVRIGDTAGTASATVTNGGTIQGKEAVIIGNETTGSVTLTDGGKIFGGYVQDGGTTVYKSLFLGGYNGTATTGSGTLTITNGSVDVNTVNLGRQGAGTITMDAGTFTAHGISYIGMGGDGTFTLNGGTVTMQELAFNHEGGKSNGKLTVNGTGATLTASKLTVSSAQGTALVDMKAGSATVSGGTTVGQNGTLNISGGTFASGCSISNNGVVNLSGGAITGATTVGQNGTLNMSGGTISGNLTIGPGTLNVKDSTAEAPATIGKETVINATGTLNINSPLNFNVNNSITLNGTMDIGEGGNFTVATTNQVFRAGQGNMSPTLNIHDGGVLEVSGGTRFLMGDAATGVVTINIDGEGSLLKYTGTAECALGFHGTGKTTLSNGGKIDTVNLQVGVNNNNNAGVVPSELTIVGKGSAVTATGTVSIGSANQKGILNMYATDDGFGTITAGTFNRYTQKESEINLGIDHGVLMTENYPADGYQIVKATTVNNWAVNDSSVWETNVSGGTVTATLAENKKAGDTEDGTVEVTDDLQIAGWVDYTIPEGWNLAMSFSGVTGGDEMENLASWINEGREDVAFTPAGNSLTLFDMPAMSGVLAWDLAGFNALYGANLALESVSVYVPEPSAFLLLLLGAFGFPVWKRVFARR